jgi:GNAT superfamily N-acetyltransferase
MPELRPASSADVDAIRAVGADAGERFRTIADPRIARCADHDPWEVAELAAYAAAGRAWVATVDDAVVGFVLVDVVDGCAHVEEVSVGLAAQGHGVGTALLDAVRDWARASGFPAVTLTTFADVPWNRPFYERRGYRVLADAEITAGMRHRIAEEAALGLDPDLRVVMRRECS